MLNSTSNYSRSSYSRSSKVELPDEEIAGNEFIVKGPIGKGLLVETTGQHIVFAAGTGILCYIDLIAMLAMHYLEVIDEVDPTDERLDTKEFKLTLYVSFKSKIESIAREFL